MPEVIRPIGDRLVVERCEADAKTPSGLLYVPDNAKHETFRAKVLAAGPGGIMDSGERRPMAVKAGDHVLIGKHYSSEYRINDRKLLVLSEAEVLGIFEEG